MACIFRVNRNCQKKGGEDIGAITVEELEIIVRANIQDAMQGLQEVKAKMQETFSRAVAPVANAMAQVNTATQKMASQSTTAYDKVNAKIREQETLLKSLISKRFEAEEKIKEAFTPDGATPQMQKDMGPMLDEKVLNDKAVIQLDTQMDKVSAKLSELQSKAAGSVAPAMKKVAEEAQKIAPQVNAAQKSAQKLAPAMTAAANQAKKLATQMKTTAKQGATAFANLGKVIARAFKFYVVYKSLRALFSFIKNGISSAVNAPEIENMFRVAFGGAAEEAAKFAEALKSAYGIDPYVSKQMLGTFQNMITSMGIANKSATQMSKGLTLLANDMASLYNIDPEQASENLQSALAGQGRAVRKYGYVILDSTIKETAYRLGIAKTGQELTEQQKVLARYMTLQEQAKNAHGDLGRTINQVANQLRIFKQNVTAAGRSIGEAFIPLIQAVLPHLNAFFIVLQRVGVALATFSFGLFGINYSDWKKQQESINGGLGDMSTAEDDIANSADKAAKAQKGLLSGFDKLNISKRKEDKTGNVGGSGDSGFEVPEVEAPTGTSPFEKMADGLIKKIKEFKELLMNLGLKEVIDNFKNFFSEIGKQFAQYDFGTAIKNVLSSGFELAMSALNLAQRIVFPIVIALDIPGIVYEAINTLTALFTMLNDVVRAITPGMENFVLIGLVPIATWIGGKIKDGLQFMQEQFKKIGDWFTQNTKLFTDFGTTLGVVTAEVWKFCEPIADAAWEIFKGIIDTIVDVVLDLAESFVETGIKIGEAWLAVKNFLDEIGVLDFIQAAIKTAITNIGNIFKTIVKIIGDVIGMVIENLGFFMDFIKAVFTGDWESAWDAISNIFGNIFDTIGKIFGGIWEFFETSFKTFSTNFEKVWDGLWKGIGNFFIGIWNGIVGAFESAINWIIGGINDVLKAINTMTGFASDLLEKVGINISFQISEIPKISFGKVPKLANGGVLKRSTIIEAGEYAGASSNPEIVAPQSLMYETSLKAQQAANQPVIVLLQRLIQSVDKGHVIEADGYNLGKLVSRTQNNNNVLLGI